jgi:formyl-CoA transferase
VVREGTPEVAQLQLDLAAQVPALKVLRVGCDARDAAKDADVVISAVTAAQTTAAARAAAPALGSGTWYVDLNSASPANKLEAAQLVAGHGGRYVEVSLLQTGLYILGCDTAMALVAREPVKRHDRKRTANALWNSYEVKGGRWIMLVMIDPNAYWPRLCEAIGRSDLLTDARFAEPFTRARNSPALIAELSVELAKHTLDEWRPRLDAAGLIWSPVHTLDEMLDDPQARAMGYFDALEHPEAGRFESLAPPFRLAGIPLGPRKTCSAVDADGEAVLREAGLDESEIAKLRRR